MQFVCTDCSLFYTYSWWVSEVSGYGYFKASPTLECFLFKGGGGVGVRGVIIQLWK